MAHEINIADRKFWVVSEPIGPDGAPRCSKCSAPRVSPAIRASKRPARAAALRTAVPSGSSNACSTSRPPLGSYSQRAFLNCTYR